MLGTQGPSMGSRLFEVPNIHPKGTDTGRRFRAALRWVARLVLVSIVGSWLFLYIDSVHQRRRAESLFADLRSLDFSTAGFAEVRDIMVRYGARPGATCNPQKCRFQLQIMTRLPRIPLQGRKAVFLYTTLPYVGIRSWVFGAEFDVRDGKLYMSSMGVWEYRMERADYRGLVPLGYG